MSNVEVEKIISNINTLCTNIGTTTDKFVIFTFDDEGWKQLSDEIKKTLQKLDVGPLHDICLNYKSLSSGDKNQILHTIIPYLITTIPQKLSGK
jgi:oligoribonuclease NrnB/cAMP/cGMP phosphodiesterase (DHH superfamily)